jgi:L-ribulose-5-phosphate 3-epimerase
MKLSCVSASYVMDLFGYPGHFNWGLASEKIPQSPLLETLDGMLDRLAPARLDGVELWFPHVSPLNLTPALASDVRRRLAARGMVCCACAGGIADPAEDPYACEEAFQVARLLGAPVIAGHVAAGTLGRLGEICARYAVRVAFENGGEKDAGEILAAIRGSGDWIGAAIDTGNMAAQGGDPVRAIRQLGARIMHVHFKDVPAVGAHDCVALGAGIVDVKGVIRELKACGYDGWLSIEVETADRDPSQEIAASAETLRRLWRSV